MDIDREVRRYRGGGRHAHDHDQILFPLRGAMQLTIQAVSGVVAGGSVAVIPPAGGPRRESGFDRGRAVAAGEN